MAVLVQLIWLFLHLLVSSNSFSPSASTTVTASKTSIFLGGLNFLGGGGSSGTSNLPKSPSDRDAQATRAIQAAIQKPKDPSLPLIEVEFQPLQALNKLGDGSLRSATLVDDANVAFCSNLVRSMTPVPMLGPKVWVLTSTTSSSTLFAKTQRLVKNAAGIASLQDGIPDAISSGDSICIVLQPSSRQDYLLARQMAQTGVARAVVLVNGLAKDQKSVGGDATMAYYLKPLTYNSQVVGYLARAYPSRWTVIDVVSNQVLATYDDSEILFGQTNTPDLRDPGRRVQKSVDERAIRARQKQ